MKLLTILFVILLSGCSTLSTVGGAKIQEVTAADVDAAIELAKLGNDPDGIACWEAVKAAFPVQGTAKVEIKGFASSLQAARNVRRGLQTGIDPVVHRNCAVLLVDAEQTAARLGLRLTPFH